MSRGAWILMAKAPVVGQVKTRLGQGLGNLEAAASLQECFLRDLLARRWHRGPRVLVWSGDLDHAVAASARAQGWEVEPQATGDLGARMHAAFAGVHTRHQVGALMTGGDCVVLPSASMAWSANQLRQGRVAFLPAQDGGYVAIGWPNARALVLDGVRWSTDQTLEDHLRRLRQTATPYALGARSFDVDNVADLARLAVHLRGPSGRAVRATTRYTRAWLLRHHALVRSSLQRTGAAPSSPLESHVSR